MATLSQVADYILHAAHEAGEPISNLKLQKLVYYAQAWSLALREEALFDERIKAWVHGPVVPSLYHRFKDRGWQPIPDEVEKPDLLECETELLEDVLNVYLGFSSWDLERLTHSEDPWVAARGDTPPDQPSDAEITPESMGQFYAQQAVVTEVED